MRVPGTHHGGSVALLRISGLFFRAISVDRVDDVLAPPSALSAGRYHRPGQPALYMSPSAEWARIATSGYFREDGIQRVIVQLEVGAANVLDQRDQQACASLGIDRELSNHSWRDALKCGAEPASWANADAARAIGANGIVDRSRHIPDGWHVTLFHWNQPGAPEVAVIGEPIPVKYRTDGPKWS